MDRRRHSTRPRLRNCLRRRTLAGGVLCGRCLGRAVHRILVVWLPEESISIVTFSEIENLESGARLDGLVAEHVFGFAVDWSLLSSAVANQEPLVYVDNDGKRHQVPPFSTSRDAAELVIQKIRSKRDGHFSLLSFTTGWKALGHTPDLLSGYPTGHLEFSRLHTAETAPVAICRAGLRVFILDDYGPSDDEVQDADDAWGLLLGPAPESAKPIFLGLT